MVMRQHEPGPMEYRSGMTFPPRHTFPRMVCRRVAAGLAFLVVLDLSGCAQMHAIKRTVGDMFHQDKMVAKIERTPQKPIDRHTSPETAITLGAIVNQQLQLGHYARGRRMLRAYLGAHPDDHAAREMMRQLTADPKTLLGKHSRPHIVQPGESYSTLAARYLGSPTRFLILARYNGSTNPSLLQVGETVQVPVSPADATRAMTAATDAAETGQAPATQAQPTTRAEQARTLQQQSLALLDQGHKEQAMARLGQALQLDPKLPPQNSRDKALRSQLIASYHQRAIVLYRDQKLDQAIALWDRVLAIDPGFEPAVIYRARALELKNRLKQL